jgi:hypothetical protein
MLDNCSYNNVKLLHDLSRLLWFLKKHAIQDALRANDTDSMLMYEKLEKDLQEYIERLEELIGR